MKSALIYPLLLAASLTLTGFSLRAVSKYDQARRLYQEDAGQVAEALYLPSGQGLEFISFGYRRALSHLLWFNTINYFAKQYSGAKDYKWLSHMCGLVTRLNPEATEYFRFCATMLAWEGNMPERAHKLLNEAIKAHPRNWLFFYLRGFVRVFFMDDEYGAARDFRRASELPDVHPLVVKLAGKKLIDMEGPEAAVEFLEEALKSSEDPYSQRVITERLQEARFEIGFRLIEQAVQSYFKASGALPADLKQLAQAGLLAADWAREGFRDEFGGRYYLQLSETDSGMIEVRSTSRERLRKAAWKRAPKASNN